MEIFELSDRILHQASVVLERTSIIRSWERIGAIVNIVGSLKSGLMIRNRDIDLHIYTDRVDISESFSVMREIAVRLNLSEIDYKNLINTQEECIEWHAVYQDEESNLWKFDMIHIRKGSKYDGVVENVTESIIKKLTPEIRYKILSIKNDIPEGEIIPGIEIYHAVFTGNIGSYDEFKMWQKINPLTNSLDWRP